MSFNARLGSSQVHRRRPFGKSHHAASSRPSISQEDAQPNELVDRRTRSGPPVVRPSAPLPRRTVRRAERGHGAEHRPVPSGSTSHSTWSSQVARRPQMTISGSSSTTSDFESWPSDIRQRRPVDPDKGSVGGAERSIPRPSRDGKPGLVQRPKSSAFESSAVPTTVLGQGASSKQFNASQSRSSNPPHASQGPSTEHALGQGRRDVAVSQPLVLSEHAPSFPSASVLFLSDLGLPPAPKSVSLRSVAGPCSTQRRRATPYGAGYSPDTFEAPVEAMPLDTMHTAGTTSALDTPTVTVKRERSPSPILTTGPHLVTEGCVRIAPLPPDCLSTKPYYKAARQKLSMSEVKKLRDLGLKVNRVFTREDGMVIDWKSQVPVMSDTLRPPPVTIDLNNRQPPVEPMSRPRPEKRKNAPLGATIDSTIEHVPGEDIVGAQCLQRAISPQPFGASIVAPSGGEPSTEGRHASPVNVNCRTTPSPSDRGVDTGVSRLPCVASNIIDLTGDCVADVDPSPVRSPVTAALAPVAATSTLSGQDETDVVNDPAIDFLKKYITAFDQDRSLLARAYSRLATLSISGPQTSAPFDGHVAPRSMPHQGRADIIAALLALPDEHPLYQCNDEDGLAEVDWDCVEVEDTGDILLITYATHDRGAAAGARGKGKGRSELWLYEQRFILKRKEWDEEDRNTPGLWPFVAVCHQMTIKPMAYSTQSDSS